MYVLGSYLFIKFHLQLLATLQEVIVALWYDRSQIKSSIMLACTTTKRVTSLWGPFPCHLALAIQPLWKKCSSSGEPFAILCPICLALDLNLRLPAPETNALPLDQQAGLHHKNL